MVATLQPEPEVLSFSCRHCHADLNVPAAMAGVSGPCPSCGQTITAPTGANERPHLVVLPPPVAAPEPAPVVVDRAVNTVPAPVVEDVFETPKFRGVTVGLFEKRGFRPMRTLIAMASAIVIFMSCYAMKSRRWVWEPTPESMAASPMPPRPAEFKGTTVPAADSTRLNVAPPAANLQARTDWVK